MCKIKSHIFCTFGSMLLNKFKEDSKGLHKKEATNCHNHAFVVSFLHPKTFTPQVFQTSGNCNNASIGVNGR
jgi:hypothetical protein